MSVAISSLNVFFSNSSILVNSSLLVVSVTSPSNTPSISLSSPIKNLYSEYSSTDTIIPSKSVKFSVTPSFIEPIPLL